MWSDATVAAEAAGTHAASHTYLAVYFVLGIAVLVAGFGSGIFITVGTVNAARATYDALATKVCILMNASELPPTSSHDDVV